MEAAGAIADGAASNASEFVFTSRVAGAATELATQHVYFAVKLAWTSDAPVSIAWNCALPVTFSASSP